ncbi:MAG: hypothetical protein AB1925_12670 [Actinomycetota bacterium]
MTFPDMQHRHNPPTEVGDCWRACIAGVTGVPIAQVPHFVGDHYDADTAAAEIDPESSARWFEATQQWLIERFNHVCLYYASPAARYPHNRPEPSAYPLVLWSGQSPRGDWKHVVIAEDTGERMIHDPHPDRTGVTELDGVFAIVRAEDWEGAR